MNQNMRDHKFLIGSPPLKTSLFIFSKMMMEEDYGSETPTSVQSPSTELQQQIDDGAEPQEEQAQEDITMDTERLEQLALNLGTAIPTRSLPKQEYMQATVVPLLLEGISWIIKERPEDPVETLAMFLIKNNPMSPELHKSLDLGEYE